MKLLRARYLSNTPCIATPRPIPLRSTFKARRSLSASACTQADDTSSQDSRPAPSSSLSSLYPSNQPRSKSRDQPRTPNLASLFSRSQRAPTSDATAPPQPLPSSTGNLDIDAFDRSPVNLDLLRSPQEQPPHHLHVLSSKHNTHITLTKPNRDALISLSAGNIGFRKSKRGDYDAAFQLAGYVLNKIKDQGLLRNIQKVELVLRGFGPGREAVTKALLGSEGRLIRPRICQVTDATRLKFGGTRSKKPRRIG
ncbi:MAG: hypothetical protein M4579_000302 [Chaenotheca gracillima]|nr:MAG: hypothetical protein M4579_000302 [Chaenotheca gracillima]